VHISNESLLVILVVGLVAGWLAGKIVQGAGFGLIGDIAIGIVGAFIGDWLLPQIGIHLGSGIVSAIVNATIGAVLLLLVVRLLQGGGRSFCFCLWFGFYKVVAVSETGADADGGSGRAWRHRLPQRKQCLNSAKQCSPGLTSPGSKTRKWHRSIDRIPVRAINHHCR
jgi:uncharacterized membrane protein YeaQ/YmgE (transglycosylase-associated protein family)